jgi:proteasome lid subunit RPN8/RPN11
MVAQCLAALLYLGVFQAELAHDPIVRAALWDLLADARYGLAETEEAMFVVRGDDGTLAFVRWSSTHTLHQAQWSEPLPRGVIAIVHTHPNRSPRPSLGDIRTAMQSNIPIYVVTRTKITKTFGGSTMQVASGDWSASSRPLHREEPVKRNERLAFAISPGLHR